MSEWLEAFLVIEAILINCILVTFYGLSGLFKEHMDYLFVKKKKNDVTVVPNLVDKYQFCSKIVL